MKIPLKNKILNINFLVVWKEPKFDKLKKELSDFFNKNDIEGIKIRDFELREDVLYYKIVPKEPYFEDTLSGGKYQDKIEEIGKKYGLKNLGFIHYCYHE